jgi:hypothetical protein
MQIAVAHKIQHSLSSGLKILKFIWRYIFVFVSFGITIQGIYEGKTPIIEGEAIILVIAVFIDWLKMQFKFSSNHSSSRDQMFESANNNMDSSRFGSSAWATNPMMAGSPANHLYNLGYMTTKYD